MSNQSERPRSPALRVLAVLVLVICLAILFSLGTWQATRFLERRDSFATMEARQAMPVVAVSSADQLGPDLDYRNISLDGGRLRMDLTVVVERRFHKHLAGNWTVTPYQFADNSVVVVHTGWVPEAEVDALQSPPAELTGIVVTPKRVKLDDLARRDPAFSLEGTPRLGELDTALIYDKAEGMKPPARPNTLVALNGPEVLQVYPMPSVEHITNPYLTPAVHFGYASLWFGSALLMIWLFWAGWTGRLDPSAR